MIIRDFAERCRRGLAELGLEPATHADVVEGRALAARTVGPNIASVATLARIQQITQASSFTFRDARGALAGVMAIIPLTAAALPGLAAGDFNGIEPPEDQAARPGQGVVAIYGWGMAGATWRGRATVMAAAVKLHRELFPAIPLYGRAATPGGERTLLKRIGARAVPGPGGLVLAPPWARMGKAA